MVNAPTLASLHWFGKLNNLREMNPLLCLQTHQACQSLGMTCATQSDVKWWYTGDGAAREIRQEEMDSQDQGLWTYPHPILPTVSTPFSETLPQPAHRLLRKMPAASSLISHNGLPPHFLQEIQTTYCLACFINSVFSVLLTSTCPPYISLDMFKACFLWSRCFPFDKCTTEGIFYNFGYQEVQAYLKFSNINCVAFIRHMFICITFHY